MMTILISIQKAYQVLSLMKTLFTAYQAQKTIQAMKKIFRVFDSGVKLIQVLRPSRFSFIGDVGMKACVTNISDPLEYFELFFTDEIVNHIVTETNIFAAENLNKFKSKEHFRTHHWSETNANELRVFFATLILQGIIPKPTVRMFWSKES
ncbi:piggyBac transposable element-derived protein 4 [Trichonephila inaurata madagascariensis]|uniref:PiggyBac transposable element-derived protein 4 n=1 Tax=Trichonephila inaurata madagascariensis TaxID=2747483 RepID=A0A8X7BWT8_9ARAC|nr:piggyBac transposable element-derived protein 4 [Trichonephila inaurata madagascariensis]